MTDRHEGWILLIAQALLLWLAAGAAGQPVPDITGEVEPSFVDGVVVSAGLGPATLDFGGQLSLWWSKGKHSVGVRNAASFNYTVFSPSSSDADIALLYGRRGGSGSTWGRIAAGPALVEMVRPGEATNCTFFGCSYEDARELTLGLALQVDGVWAFSEPVGLGITVFGNVSSSGPFFGAALSLHVGKVGT